MAAASSERTDTEPAGSGYVPPQEPTPEGEDAALTGTAHDPLAGDEDPARPPWGSYGPGYAPTSIGQLRSFGSGRLGGWEYANDGGEFG